MIHLGRQEAMFIVLSQDALSVEDVKGGKESIFFVGYMGTEAIQEEARSF
jgi:hypothetical protein